MKSLIIYKGKYGATEQYARWLAADLSTPVVAAEEADDRSLAAADLLLLGSAVYFGKLLIRDWLKKHLYDIKDKKLILFIVCGTPLQETQLLNNVLQTSVPEEIRNRCEVYFLPGRLIRQQLSRWDRFVMNMAERMSRKKDGGESVPADYDRVSHQALDILLNKLKTKNLQGSQAEEALHRDS